MPWLDITQILLLLGACFFCYLWGKVTGVTGTVNLFLEKRLITMDDLDKLD